MSAVFAIWRQPVDRAHPYGALGVTVGVTEGEATARVRVERGPGAEVLEVHDDWSTALARYGAHLVGAVTDHELRPACTCAACSAYIVATCEHWPAQAVWPISTKQAVWPLDAPSNPTIAWCSMCARVVDHVTEVVRVRPTGDVNGEHQHVLVKRSLSDPDGPVELRLPSGRCLFVDRYTDVEPVAADLL